MTIANVNSNLNAYLYNYLKPDLLRIQTEMLAEISESQETSIPVQGSREIIDEYVPSIKPKVEVTLEERMDQVISFEEIKNLLSLIAKIPPDSSVGQLVDVKG